MPFSEYDPDTARFLSALLSEIIDAVERSARFPRTEAEMADISTQIAISLIKGYRRGERDPSTLKRSSLRHVRCFEDSRAASPEIPTRHTLMRTSEPSDGAA